MKTANSSPSTNGRCHPKKRTPETDCPKPTGAMRVRHAAPQGLGLPGGQIQKYINDLERLIKQ